MVTLNQQREDLWKRLEAEISKAGLEVVSKRSGEDTRNFEPLVKLVGREKSVRIYLSFACLDDWRESEIRAAIRQAKRDLEK